MKRVLKTAALVCGLVLVGFGLSQPVGAQGQNAVIIEGATLIDGRGGRPVADSAVVIQGNRITAVGRRGRVRAPAGAQVVDARGKFLLPGLIDAKQNYTANIGEANLIWGTTSVICSGCGGDAANAERDAINHGMMRGARLFTSFATLNGVPPVTGGQGGGGAGQGGAAAAPPSPSRYGYEVRTPQEARDLSVKFLDIAGADFISAGDGDGPPEVYAAMVEEAHKRGKAAVMRTVGPLTAARECAMMGCDVLIHTGQAGSQITTDATAAKWKNYIAQPPDQYSDMDDDKARELIKLLVERKVALEPEVVAMDLGFPKNWDRVQQEDAAFFAEPVMSSYYPQSQINVIMNNVADVETYLTPEQIDVRRRGFHNHMRFLKMFVDAGGHLVAASDGMTRAPGGLGLHQEMAIFVEDAGLTPMQAIQSATGWAQEAFKLKDVGTVEVGKLADLLIVSADPTRDILNLRKIDSVYFDGKPVDRRFTPNYLETTFRAGLQNSGACCFSSPVIEGEGWRDAMRQATVRGGGGGGAAPAPDPLNSPTPGVDMIMPYVINFGSGDTTITVTGFNFVQKSQVLVNGRPVPTRAVSRTQLQATVPAATFQKAGRYSLVVKNPAPIQTFDWGDTSNYTSFTVPYAFTTKHSHNQF